MHSLLSFSSTGAATSANPFPWVSLSVHWCPLHTAKSIEKSLQHTTSFHHRCKTDLDEILAHLGSILASQIDAKIAPTTTYSKNSKFDSRLDGGTVFDAGRGPKSSSKPSPKRCSCSLQFRTLQNLRKSSNISSARAPIGLQKSFIFQKNRKKMQADSRCAPEPQHDPKIHRKWTPKHLQNQRFPRVFSCFCHSRGFKTRVFTGFCHSRGFKTRFFSCFCHSHGFKTRVFSCFCHSREPPGGLQKAPRRDFAQK